MYRVFISYSHIDEDWKDRLEKQLTVLELQKLLCVWNDRKIGLGEDWRATIEQEINQAQVAVLLISTDFLNSKFILDEEVPRFLQKRKLDGLVIIPLIISPCQWQSVDWLGAIQGYPRDNKALTGFGQHDAEQCLSDLAGEINRLLSDNNARDKYQTNNFNYSGIKKNPQQIFHPDPSLLTYLLDREEQEEDLINAIERHTDFKHPLFVIIHGTEDDCCGDKFIERVVAHLLPKIPVTQKQIKDISPRVVQVELGASKNVQQLHNNMRRSLGGAFINDKTANLEQISMAFCTMETPILLHATLSAKDCLRCDGTKTVQHFLDFWKNWQVQHRQNYLILVFLYIHYEPQQKLFFIRKQKLNTQIEKTLASLNFSELKLFGTVLRKLPLIEETHIREWAQSPPVCDFFNRSIYQEVRKEVKNIFEKHKTDALSLGQISSELMPLLKQLQQQVKP